MFGLEICCSPDFLLCCQRGRPWQNIDPMALVRLGQQETQTGQQERGGVEGEREGGRWRERELAVCTLSPSAGNSRTLDLRPWLPKLQILTSSDLGAFFFFFF